MSNRISVPKIMRSAAGWYVGTSFTEFIEDKAGNVLSTFEIPNERLSPYFKDKSHCRAYMTETLSPHSKEVSHAR